MKIIDLYIMLSKGEQPKKFKYRDEWYAYSVDDYDFRTLKQEYRDADVPTYQYLMEIIDASNLNDEVEILEEEKKIPEKLGKIDDNDGYIDQNDVIKIGKTIVEEVKEFEDGTRIIVMADGFDEYDENEYFLEAGIVTKEQFERMEYKVGD